jgi:hypothetical protein
MMKLPALASLAFLLLSCKSHFSHIEGADFCPDTTYASENYKLKYHTFIGEYRNGLTVWMPEHTEFDLDSMIKKVESIESPLLEKKGNWKIFDTVHTVVQTASCQLPWPVSVNSKSVSFYRSLMENPSLVSGCKEGETWKGWVDYTRIVERNYFDDTWMVFLHLDVSIHYEARTITRAAKVSKFDDGLEIWEDVTLDYIL